MSSGKYRKELNCLNCGSHVEKHYCSNCGQPNLELKESFWAFISHSIGHYFHFDNKFFQTLTPLLTKPGQVTLDYLAGKRARYINPVSMYIFVSIVYFLIVPKASVKVDHEDKQDLKTANHRIESPKILLDSIHNELAKENIENDFLKNVTENINDKLTLNEFEKLSFKDQEKTINELKAKKNASNSDSINNILLDFQKYHIIKQDSTYDAYLARQKKLAPAEQDNWYERWSKKREITVNEKTATGHWTITEEIEHYKPKQYFLLMPLLAFFILLNFRRNHIYYLDHLIFTIHGMTAYFIVEIINRPIIKYIFGIDSGIGDALRIGVLIWICWYLYTALRVFYNRSRKATIWKMLCLFILYALSFYTTKSIVSSFIYYFLA